MSILAALCRSYDRMASRHEVPPFGYSTKGISYILSLNPDGSLAGPPIDIRDTSTKKPTPRSLSVPQPPKRTSGIAPFFLWDKTSYVLGITAGEGNRLKEEHQAFIDYHVNVLANEKDEGLLAVRTFLENWNPESFSELDWPEEVKSGILDKNVVFMLESERQSNTYIHDRLAARKIWEGIGVEVEDKRPIEPCLVTGVQAPVCRLHPSIMGVWGAKSTGASIVSYNNDSFASYGHEQGDNAQVSEAAAFAYTTALNKFLEKGSSRRIQIGDTSTVFWAEAPDADLAQQAEEIFSFLNEVDEEAEAKSLIRPILEKIRNGQPVSSAAPALSKGVRFYILGLSPNAARISIRFWMEDSFGNIMENYQRFLSDMKIEPPDQDKGIALWKYLCETAVQGKSENVAPNLAGAWMSAILTGSNYPYTLLSTVLMRIRATHEINARRVAILKSILVRNFKMEVPVAFDPENSNKGYLLGRLFAVYERVQIAASGDKINATVKDKFYGSASAQPRKVFHLLESGSANHLSKLGKQKPGYKVVLEKILAEIFDKMSPADDPFPASLSAEQQALFGVGYYHQRQEFFKSHDSTPATK